MSVDLDYFSKLAVLSNDSYYFRDKVQGGTAVLRQILSTLVLVGAATQNVQGKRGFQRKKLNEN